MKLLLGFSLGQFIQENAQPVPRSTEFSRRQKEKGGCVVCGENAFGRSRCPAHLAAIAKTMRERRAQQKRAA